MPRHLLRLTVQKQRQRKRRLLQSRNSRRPRIVERPEAAEVQTPQKRQHLFRTKMIGRDRQNRDSILRKSRRQSSEGRQLRDTGTAPRRPEMKNSRLPPKTRKIPFGPVRVRETQRRQNQRRMRRNLRQRNRSIRRRRGVKRFARHRGCD